MEYKQDVQEDPPAEDKSGMRPALLNPLFAEVGSLEGVGPRYAMLLGKRFTIHQSLPCVI